MCFEMNTSNAGKHKNTFIGIDVFGGVIERDPPLFFFHTALP